MKAIHVLSAEYEFSEEPIETDEIDGLNEAIERVRNTKDKELVRCEDRITDYDVYWNDTTESVRVGAVVMAASYEVSVDE